MPVPNPVDLLVSLHATTGNGMFLVLTLAACAALSLVGIPRATDVMVACAAGLADHHLGARWRSFCINASTNNPEAFSMLLAFAVGRVGGWGNPLGSLLANIYLMFGLGFLIVAGGFLIRGQRGKLDILLGLIRAEWKLVVVHFLLSVAMFVFGYLALRLLMSSDDSTAPSWDMVPAAGLLAGGIVLFVVVMRWMIRSRPNLEHEADSSDFHASWKRFLWGTALVVLFCWMINVVFLAWTELYYDALSRVFGTRIFAWLHYFVGAVITSLPELTVTIGFLKRLRAPELNIALGSVSYSNMVNLAIALIGLGVWIALAWSGYSLEW